jgi:FixJ family two-component response regulator
MKAGAFDLVEKPYRAADMIGLLQAAVALDDVWRLAEARHGALRARFDALSRRERQVMALVTTGLLNKQVAGYLGVSEITVKAHRGAMMRKMGAGTLAELVRMADTIGEACRACGIV